MSLCAPLQYARADKLETWRREHLKAMSSLREMLETAEAKLNAPVQLAYSPLSGFLQDVEVLGHGKHACTSTHACKHTHANTRAQPGLLLIGSQHSQGSC